MDDKRKLSDFMVFLQSHGKYSFSFQEAELYTHNTITGLRQELERMNKKGGLVTVRKGYNVIVPPEYRQNGLMPPELFIHPLMKWLNKPYYIGLLSAAAIHGSAHQQPQELFVVTTKPALRSIEKRGHRIRFVVNKSWQTQYISEVKTDTGFVLVSSPEMTVTDLVWFYKTVGGLTRASEVIKDLVPLIKVQKLKKLLQSDIPVATLQRLGYILSLLNCPEKLTGTVRDVLRKKESYWIPLLPGYNQLTGIKNHTWKIIENTFLDVEL